MIKKKNAKRNVWISISATAVVAVIVVCGCIPLMRQTPLKEHYYSDGDVTANRITINDIVNDSNRDFRLFNIDYIDDYALRKQYIRIIVRIRCWDTILRMYCGIKNTKTLIMFLNSII